MRASVRCRAWCGLFATIFALPLIAAGKDSPGGAAPAPAGRPQATAYSAVPAPAKGAAAKALSLPGLDGTTHSLADWNGQVILLNFWASWCSPCLAEIPDLVAFQEVYGGRGLKVVGVGIDEAHKLNNVARTLGMNYPILVADPDSGGLQVMEPWGNTSGVIPFTVVIDRDGRVVFKHRGPLQRDELDEVLRPLLAGASGK